MITRARRWTRRHPAHAAGRGFTLVEIMVGMVIGVLGMIVMMQVLALSESQKRTTVGGNDAQNSGAIALYGLQRDARQAGWGSNDPKLLGCNVLLRVGVTLNNMAPVTINHPDIPAGDAGTDTLLIAYGSASGSPEGDGITAQPLAAGAAAYPNVYSMQTPTTFAAGDQIIATPQTRPDPCSLRMTTILSVGTGSPANVVVTAGTGIAATNGIVFNLGTTPRMQVYAVRSGNLTACDYSAFDCRAAANAANPSAWVSIAANIVSLRAHYGRDTSTPVDAVVDVYDQTTPSTACNWARISAVRLVLVARSGQYEKTAVTPAAPQWAGTATDPIVLTAGANWQNYRYRTFETVVPIRNMVWTGAQSGC